MKKAGLIAAAFTKDKKFRKVHLEVKVELADGSLLENYAGLESLRNSIHHNLKTVLGIDTKVSLVEHKSLERFQGKAKRIVDLRDNK